MNITVPDARLRTAAEKLHRDMPDRAEFTVEQVERAAACYLTEIVWYFLHNPNLLAADKPALLQGALTKAKNGHL